MDLAAFGKFGNDIQRLRMKLEEICEEDQRELKEWGQAKELNVQHGNGTELVCSSI
jgi:phage host-nuclease inhibitor protein Gam